MINACSSHINVILYHLTAIINSIPAMIIRMMPLMEPCTGTNKGSQSDRIVVKSYSGHGIRHSALFLEY